MAPPSQIHDVKNANDNTVINTTLLQSIKQKYLHDTQHYDVNKTDFFDKYRNYKEHGSHNATTHSDPLESIISKYTPQREKGEDLSEVERIRNKYLYLIQPEKPE